MRPTRKQGNQRRLLFAGIGIPVLAVAVFFLSAPIRRHHRAQHDVDELMLALKAYEITFGDLPQGTPAEICAALRGSNPMKEAVVESYETNPAGEFIDPWGTPYRMAFARTTRIYSCGPNKIDDQGTGDDIVAQ